MRTRRLLRNDVWRHLCAQALLVVFFLASLPLLPAQEDPRGRWSLVATLVLGVYGLYGPCYLLLSRLAFGGLRGKALRAQLQRTRQGGLARSVLVGGPGVWAVSTVTLGLAGILTMAVSDVYGAAGPLVAVCGVVCVVGTWVLLLSIYAVEYMRLWADGGGIDFPSADEDLVLADFFYLAVQVSTTFAGSDVTLRTTRARRLVTTQALVAFAYSTVIIAVLASALVSVAA